MEYLRKLYIVILAYFLKVKYSNRDLTMANVLSGVTTASTGVLRYKLRPTHTANVLSSVTTVSTAVLGVAPSQIEAYSQHQTTFQV